MKWYLIVLKKYAVFTGRARRTEFWMYTLFSIIFSIVASILDWLMGLNGDSPFMSGGWISRLYSIAVFIPGLAVTVRRFHDIGKSGWVYARFLISMMLIGFFILGYMAYTIMKGGGIEALKDGEIDPSVFTGSFLMVCLVLGLLVLGLSIWLIVLLCKDSQPQENKWGANPKAEELPLA